MSTDPNLPKPHLLIDMTFDPSTSKLGVEKVTADGYDMDKDGNITLLQTIELGSHGVIRFRALSSDPDIQGFVGLRLARSEAELETADILLDTQESYFEDTPFKVSHEQLSTADHLDLRTFSDMQRWPVLNLDWFYTVGVLVTGLSKPIWLDPRIHNKGENL